METNLSIFTDGGARGNPGRAAIGGVIKTETAHILAQFSQLIGISTNNEAEYLALLSALDLISKNLDKFKINQGSSLKFFSDSSLLVNQVNGIFKVKNSRMREFILKVRSYESQIPGKIIYNLIPREKNLEADALVNKALDDISL